VLEEDGEAEVRGLERGVLLVIEEQEVLGLEIPVEDAHGVAAVDDGDDLAAERGGGALGVVALGDDAVEELPALAELHDEVDRVPVLVGSPELDDVAVAREVVHDLHLPAHVLDVVSVDELPRGDGLAGEALPGLPVRDEVGDPELAPPELAAEGVGRAHVLHGPSQHAPHRPRPRPRRRLRLRLLRRRGLLVLLLRRRRLGLGLGRGRRGRLLLGGGAVVARRTVAHGCLPGWGVTKGRGRRCVLDRSGNCVETGEDWGKRARPALITSAWVRRARWVVVRGIGCGERRQSGCAVCRRASATARQPWRGVWAWAVSVEIEI